MTNEWTDLVEELSERCHVYGLDLVQPFPVHDGGVTGRADGLPDPGTSPALGVLIGNTRALWPAFLDWLGEAKERLDSRDPLDDYVESSVVEALRAVPCRWQVRWAHQVAPRAVAMQRLAELAGLASLSPSKLSIHRQYGPWISLRAAVVIDVDGGSVPSRTVEDVCSRCERPCMSPFEKALAMAMEDPPPRIEDRYLDWLAVRQSCPIGSDHGFEETQTRYHYTKDVKVIKDALSQRCLLG